MLHSTVATASRTDRDFLIGHKHVSVRRGLKRLQQFIHDLFSGLNPSRGRLQIARSVSTVGVVLGVSIIVSALIFPRFPARVFAFVLGDYTALLDALVVSERLFSLLAGVLILTVASLVHFVLDMYMGTLGAFWNFSGDAFLRLVVLCSFVIAFAAARIFVILSGIVGPSTGGSAGWLPISEVWVRGYHVHHFFFGFLFLVVAGWAALFDRLSRLVNAVLYGVGLGIFVDEFGLLLTEGEYFASASYFVAIVLVSLILVGIYWDRLSERHPLVLNGGERRDQDS